MQMVKHGATHFIILPHVILQCNGSAIFPFHRRKNWAIVFSFPQTNSGNQCKSWNSQQGALTSIHVYYFLIVLLCKVSGSLTSLWPSYFREYFRSSTRGCEWCDSELPLGPPSLHSSHAGPMAAAVGMLVFTSMPFVAMKRGMCCTFMRKCKIQDAHAHRRAKKSALSWEVGSASDYSSSVTQIHPTIFRDFPSC